MNTLESVLLFVVLVIVGLLVLRIVASIAGAVFWPLLLVAVGVGLGVWWTNRRRKAT